MAFENKITKMQRLYKRYASAVVYIAVENKEGLINIGSAFHIGDGIFVTAKHVIESQTITEVSTTTRIVLTQKNQGERKSEVAYNNPRKLNIVKGPCLHSSEDVAVFKVDIENISLPSIQLGSHISHEIQDGEFVLANALVIGYPPIPFTITPNQVVASGQVNAVINVRHSKYVHFVLSAMARGGFSGGVVLSESGFALGLVTESLGTGDSVVETGYMSVMSIDSAIDLAEKYFDIDLTRLNVYRDLDTLIEVKMATESLKNLNSRLFNACVSVYDDDKDVFIEIHCDNQTLLSSAHKVFNSITPTYIIKSMSKDDLIFFQPKENPSASLLRKATQEVMHFFEDAGYKKISTKQNSWQMKN